MNGFFDLLLLSKDVGKLWDEFKVLCRSPTERDEKNMSSNMKLRKLFSTVCDMHVINIDIFLAQVMIYNTALPLAHDQEHLASNFDMSQYLLFTQR